ncbi:serine protease [Paractinoplanes rishiriensis]|uniref:NACHT domain-containing protein n=1 Tax=Paractinoplanes rishiriensis TaxID=1050105 RepID=A0A919N0R5_9ACTN|nr:serine protease [Actinoplanes rishiriensis]GIE99965.1 hypothetical protein Ari01nite_74300 [Actinoplanes rishiriensis]
MGDLDAWLAPPSPSLVKICTEDGVYRGTGFFVAKRTVVTCAHVVEHHENVVIGWSGPDLPGRVLVRDPPSRAGAGGSYPGPDIAFIGVETLDNPRVFLETSAVGRDLREFFIEGFSTLNPTGGVALERRMVPVLGEADRYLLLSDSYIVPGMSGSPVVEREGSDNVRGMLKSARLAKGSSAYMIPAWEIKKSYRLHKAVLRAHMRDLPTLVRPRAGTPLHMLLTAQREVAQRYPYRVASLTRREPPPLTSVYVEQRTQPHKTRRDLEPEQISPIDLLHRHRNALIVSGAGGGKSTLIQQLVATSASWWLQEPDGAAEPPLGRVVAVYAAAQDLLERGSWPVLLARAVHNDLGGRLDSVIAPEYFERPPAPGADWLILVDGLDEVHDRETRRELMSVLASRVGRYGSNTRFLVASRPLEEREFTLLRTGLSGSDRTKRFGEYDLRPFDWERVKKFAGNWFRPVGAEQSAVEPADFLDAIATAGLAPLVEVPLLATIAAIVFEEKPTLPLPLDRAGLYETFVRVLLTLRVQRLGVRRALHDQLTPLGRAAEEFGERLLEDRLPCLSFLAVQYLKYARRLSDALPDWIRDRYSRLPFGVSAEHVRDLLVETGLVAIYGDDLVFIHQSFAEYLASLLLVGEFDPAEWLQEVRSARPDSLGLFVLAAWGDAGHDTRPVVEALMEPGEKRQYPHLRQAAAMIQDGGVLASGGTREIIELAEAAVRQVEVPARAETKAADPTIPAVREALRAILQRTRDATRVVRMIGDNLLSVRKRAEAGRVLVTSENPADHEVGLVELLRLAYETGLRDIERLQALSVIVEVAPRHERLHAVQRLAQFVETAHDLGIRMEAMEILRRHDQIPAAAAALLRRALDMHRPEAEREEAGLLLSFYLEDSRTDWSSPDSLDAGDEWEEKTWRAVVSRPVPGDTWTMLAVRNVTAAAGVVLGTSAIGRYVRARPIDWRSRSLMAMLPSWGWLTSPAGQSRVPPTEPLSWHAVTLLASDGQEPWSRRIGLLVDYARKVPGRTGDVTALLDRWMRAGHAPMKERHGILSALFTYVDADDLRVIALDAGLPVVLRLRAAVEHGLRADKLAETYALLLLLSRAPTASWWERVECRLWRKTLPLLARLNGRG